VVAGAPAAASLDGRARAVEPRAGGSASAACLEVAGLTHAFGDRRVLDGLSFALGRGEILALMGPNGSGKSTTLHVLMGLVVPDAGTIRLDGVPCAPGGRALRRAMGVVFQAPSLDVRLTARENLRFAAALHGLGGAVARARVDALLASAALADRADEPVRQYSGGMKRRLELARALLPEPVLLVMDEPTTGLDEHGFRDTWERVARMRAEHGLTVLFTTHRADEAARADRVIVVDHGRAIATGTPDALCAQVSGDVLTIDAEDAEELARELTARLGIACRVSGERVQIERERGHELVPRIVEAFAPGRVRSLSMHRPTLADVFVKLTGRALGGEESQDGV
jgi:ABC-2 type transport system ATP-binding protein